MSSQGSPKEGRPSTKDTLYKGSKVHPSHSEFGQEQNGYLQACFSINLQIIYPETSYQLYEENKAAKITHLDDTIKTKQWINKLIKLVEDTVVP